MKTDSEAIAHLLTRNVEEVFVRAHLEAALKAGKKLRVKHGIDPTAENIHLGRAVVLWKLREFQELGHKIVIIIGDFTAQIGDPSDKLEKRPFLTGDDAASYAACARALEIEESSVRVALHRLRRQFGQCLRATLAETVDDPADVDQELE